MMGRITPASTEPIKRLHQPSHRLTFSSGHFVILSLRYSKETLPENQARPMNDSQINQGCFLFILSSLIPSGRIISAPTGGQWCGK